MVKDMNSMLVSFKTGKYVADTSRQAEVFGPPPTAEDAVGGGLLGVWGAGGATGPSARNPHRAERVLRRAQRPQGTRT
jgi:hypothetical protein